MKKQITIKGNDAALCGKMLLRLNELQNQITTLQSQQAELRGEFDRAASLLDVALEGVSARLKTKLNRNTYKFDVSKLAAKIVTAEPVE